MKRFLAVCALFLCGSLADAAVVGNALNRLFNQGRNHNHNHGQQQQLNRFFNQSHNHQGHHHHGQAQFFNGGYVNRNFFPGYGAGYGASFAPQCYVPPQVPIYYYQPPVVQQQPQYYLAPQPVLQFVPQYAPVYAPACGVGYGQGCGVGAGRLFGY